MVVCLPGQPQSATAAPPLAVCFEQPLENTSTTHLRQIANDHTVPLNFLEEFLYQKPYSIDLLCFSVLPHASFIDFSTASTTVWHQSKIQC